MGRGPYSAEFSIPGISLRLSEKANDLPIIPAGRGPPPADSDHPSGLAQNQPDRADAACSGLGRVRDREKAVFDVFGIVLFSRDMNSNQSAALAS